jgi:uncharacterized protein YyaL (SSP411 family)
LRGWSAPYPETTGYIIETLLDYYAVLQEDWLRDYALAGADWICTLQRPNGALPGGLGTEGKDSVFNTGMMLFGLHRAYLFTQNHKYLNTTNRAADWLLESLSSDATWKQGAYVEGYIPAYYTRVIWALLSLNETLQRADIQDAMQKAMSFYKHSFNDNGTVKNWAFRANEKAFTHTIAYTQRGFLESARFLKDESLLKIAMTIALTLMEDFDKNGKLAGAYDENWQGDYSFRCNTGNAQLSLNLSRLSQLTDNQVFAKYAQLFFKTVECAPSTLPFRGYRGAIAGSKPIWGAYQPFQYVNWAAKFWLDAAFLLD